MVLLSFSIPEHIPLIKSGKKAQTTRIPRKPRSNGKPAYSVGDKIQLYYRSRQKDTCNNCIVDQPCGYKAKIGIPIPACTSHIDFFGETTVTEIIHYDGNHQYAENGNEIWMGCTIGHLDDEDRESWAVADGFKNWDAADDWFVRLKNDGYDNFWHNRSYDVITWEKEPIVKRWKRTD